MRGFSGTAKSGNIYRYYGCKSLVVNKCKQILNNENIAFIAKQIYEVCQKENNKNLIIKE